MNRDMQPTAPVGARTPGDRVGPGPHVDLPLPPSRFRRRLLVVMLLAGWLPLVLLGALAQGALERVLSVSVAPVEGVLDEVSAELARRELPRDALNEARLNLAQAELARSALVRRVPAFITGLVLLSGAALTVAAVLLGRALTRPVSTLTEGMWAYARGDLSVRLDAPEPPGDELQFLLGQFNKMGQELLSQRERLKSAEQIAAWQDVARALAHELKNPLTAMKLSLARLTRTDAATPHDATRITEAVALLQEEVDLLMRMTQSFSTFARLPTPRFQDVPLRPLLAEVCTLYAGTSPVPVELLPGPEATLRADPDGLRRLFGNLVKNAAEASASNALPVHVALEPLSASGVRVTVKDGGSGVAQVLEGPALTRGLFSTKPGGSGLGLPISQKIVHEHGGTLRLEPAPGGGTLARVDLPLTPPTHA
ncbi:Nitrogen regulation protein ntrY [Myxococcus hansupus]|uniref:Signal transduction histidine-protein kinase/phosphatase MprB n=1 Tax=Pseudomyxococcus hansupus TaxID=1297742 RepID=A0A0H4XKS5_9BACT|nr:ATP-binding protein [Myxococcus hansupus]AKQ68852.1 Nitrogen regulation protein ntrY [Myxococcus hansupus]